MNPKPESNAVGLGYRAEIDGLRAIAVVSVILYHAQLVVFGRDWFTGGYIGVDVFFVISGYLITRIILTELEQTGAFSFGGFYERRARRIIPVLLVVIIATLPFAWLKLLPSDLVEFGQSVLSALLFGSNFFFYFSTTEYGADSSLLKPFLHTWSLGVEEQFYLLFPVFAILGYRFFRAQFALSLIVLCACSLAFAEIMVRRNYDLNFFLPLSRIWELGVGSLLALGELRRGYRRIDAFRKAFPLLGLGLLLCSFWLFDGKTPHPGLYTLLPIVGVALIIRFSSQQEPVGKLLGSKPFVWVGLISYSAYLWHFPLFAFARTDSYLDSQDKLLLILATVVLSICSYWWVEVPFRKRSLIGVRRFAVAMTASSTIVVAALITFMVDGLPGRFSSELLAFESHFERDNRKLRRASWEPLRDRLKQNAAFSDVRSKVLIVGNSHAKDTYNALSQNIDSLPEFDFLRLHDSANIQLSCFTESLDQATGIRDEFYESEMFRDATTILVSTYWSSSNTCDKRRQDWPRVSDFQGARQLIQRSLEAGKRVVLMGQSPHFKRFSTGGKARKTTIADGVVLGSLSQGADASFSVEAAGARTGAEMFKAIDWQEYDKVWAQLSRISAETGVPLYSKLEMICDAEGKTCDGLTSLGEKTFYDGYHYTLPGAALFGRRLAMDAEFVDMIR